MSTQSEYFSPRICLSINAILGGENAIFSAYIIYIYINLSIVVFHRGVIMPQVKLWEMPGLEFLFITS